MTNLDQKNVWKIVEKIRISLLSEHSDLDCNSDSDKALLLSDKNILNNINSLAAELKLNMTSIPNRNVSKETLQIAVEMFTYLNICPTKLLKFTSHLFKTGTTREMILALTSIIKTIKNDKEKELTIKNLNMLLNSFSLGEYEKIQILTKGKCYTNATFGNCLTKVKVKNSEILGSFKLPLLLILFLRWDSIIFRITKNDRNRKLFIFSFRNKKASKTDKSSSSHS